MLRLFPGKAISSLQSASYIPKVLRQTCQPLHPRHKTTRHIRSTAMSPGWTNDESSHGPSAQQYFEFHDSKWIPFRDVPPQGDASDKAAVPRLNTMWLITWNIDFRIPYAEPRMDAALEHLEGLVQKITASEPVVVFLQEMVESDLRQIRAASWIQSRFHITDIDSRSWRASSYGTTTLIDRSLSVKNVFRVPWVSNFDRDGLFVDVALEANSSKIVRLCNTHLESLVANPPIRPQQLAAASKYLHEDGVHAALLAGDLNAIQPFDATLHSENNLEDVYLSLGGTEDSDEGYTWGYQSPEEDKKYGRSRMDKVLVCGAVKPVTLERIGVDVKAVLTPNSPYSETDSSDEDDTIWVTDHYGLMTQLSITDGLASRT